MKLHKYWAPVLFLCVGLTAATAQIQKLRVEHASAKIYIEPHENSTVIGTVSKGTILTLFDSGAAQKDRSWFYVSFYSEEKWATITGFVQASRVSMLGGTQAAPAEELPVPVKKQEPAKKPPPPKTVTPAKPEVKAEKAAAAVEEAAAISDGEPSPSPGTEADLVRCTGEVKVSGERPAIRAAAADEGRILLLAKFGEVLELNGKKGDWYRVKYPRPDGIVLVGFVNAAQVEVLSSSLPMEDPAPVEPEPEKEEGLEAAAAAAAVATEAAKETETREAPVPVTAPPPAPPVPEQDPSAVQESDSMGIRPLSLALNAGYALPSESGYEGGFVFGGDLAYLLHRNLAVVLGFYRYQTQIEGSPEGLSKGKLTSMPLSLGLQGRYPLSERLIPYLAAGVAYHFNTFKLCQICQDNWDALGFDVLEEVKSSMGFQVGVGLDYEVTSYIDLNLDVRYQISKGSGSWSQTDQFSGTSVSGDLDSLNFDALIIRIGAKIFLKI